MYKDKKVAVVIPAFNEEVLITKVIDTMPDYVDRIVIVDDCSKDKTCEKIEELKNDKVILLKHEFNSGPGRAIATGYQWVLDNEGDVIVSMDGDGQMDPDDMPALLDPLIEGKTDCTKGNRLFTGEAWEMIPKIRYFGNSTLSFLTKIASGYWHIADSQTGYRAMTREILGKLPLKDLYARYGFPNHLLVLLNIESARVIDVPIKPIYNVGEKSGIKLQKVIPRISWLLTKLFFKRLGSKYVIRDFHPLVLFYAMGFLLTLVDIPLIIRLFFLLFAEERVFMGNFNAVIFLSIMAIQFFLFAMWFDMDYNKELK